MRDGNPAERCVAAVLREAGYLVASRRHEPGPGDHLAVPYGSRFGLPLLVETKGGQGTGEPWKNFTLDNRQAMIRIGTECAVIPLLAWVLNVDRREVCWLEPSDWPAPPSVPCWRL